MTAAETVPTDPVLRVEDLSVEYATSHGWATVIDRVSLEVRRGETLGVVGESGSGKTVTSLAIMGLLPTRGARVTSGRLLFEGEDITRLPRRQREDLRGRRIAMVLQEPMTSLDPAFTVGDQIAEVIRRHRRVSRAASRRAAVELLSKVGIAQAERRARCYPHEFSGGMRQRVALAIALSCEPQLLIADEPTTALDVTVQAQILELLKQMRDEYSLSMMFISHDMGVVADICDRIAVMYAGQVVEQGDIFATFEAPAHPYTKALLQAMPTIESRQQPETVAIPGAPPLPWAMPEGCRFHPRCAHARDECAAGPVALRPLAGQVTRCVRAEELREVVSDVQR